MSEQSDTPRVYAVLQSFGFIAHTDRAAAMWLDTVINIARDLERELATATRERDEARAIANDRDAMVDHRDRALTAMYQRVDVITRERDEARAEAARKFCGVGELERAGYIPAGSADEREAKP